VKVLVSGATGFIGRALVPALLGAGHDVLAMTRRVDQYPGPGIPVLGDTDDAASLRGALHGCDAAYYLIHALDEADGFERDAAAAERFGQQAAEQELSQLVYLGGLGRQGDDLSDHLASRQEVEGLLAKAGVPVTALRAALVIGPGSASYELLLQVVANLPLVVIPPRASQTLVQPIALRDVLRYLVGVLGHAPALGRVFEIGGPDVMTYEDMLHRMAAHLGKDTPGLKLPFLPEGVAKLGVKLLTDVDAQLAATLLESLGNDVIVDDDRIRALFPGPLLTFEGMLDEASR
jgi:uncharacterized protein YbjT (DUF2867 family)